MNSSKEIFYALTKSSLGVSSKIVFNAVAIKIIAVFMGPSGVGLFSQIRQLWQTFVTIGSINSGAAVIQGVSSRKKIDKNSFTCSIFWAVFVVNSLVSLLIIFYAYEISQYFLKSLGHESIQAIRWLALSSFISVFLIFFSSILNGYNAIGRYSIVIAIGSFSLMVLTWPIALKSSNFILGIVYLLIISELIALIACIALLIKSNLFRLSLPSNIFASSDIKNFFKTSSVLLVTGICTMLVLLSIRLLIIDNYGFYGAGIFDAAWLLCMVYVLVITKSFGTYFLPKLSGIQDLNVRNNLLNEGIRIVILVSVPVIVTMISLKPLILSMLYTVDFMESLDIIKWMLIGDFFKIISWLLAFTMLAYKDMKIFLWSELIFLSALLLGIIVSLNFIDSYESIGIIFFAVSVPYFIFTVRYNQIKHGFKLNKLILLTMLVAFTIIIISSITTWDIVDIDYRVAIVNVIISVIFSWFVLTKNERNFIIRFFTLELK